MPLLVEMAQPNPASVNWNFGSSVIKMERCGGLSIHDCTIFGASAATLNEPLKMRAASTSPMLNEG